MDQNSDEGQNGRKPRSRKGRGQRSQPEPGSSIPTALATSSTPSAGWPQFQTTQQLFFPLAGFGGNGVFTQDAEVPLQAGFFNSNPFSAGSPPPVSSSDNTPTGFLTRNQAPGIVSYFDPSKAFRTGMEAGNRGKQRPRRGPNPGQHSDTRAWSSSATPAPTQSAPLPEAKRDAIVAPGADSGGIPEPTSAYLLRASFMAQTVPLPRPMLVVIDLNGTLLYRPSRRAPSTFVERPHARAFLTYCIETFHVVIWSSARPDNVKKMCRQLLTPEQQHRVVATWGRDRFGLTPTDYNKRVQCYKRLTTLWDDPLVASSHPEKAQWNQGNTVLIDDSVEKARSEPFNAITLPEFVGDEQETPEVLPLVHDYLNTLAVQADTSTYIRTHPFNPDHTVLDTTGDDH